MSTVSLEAKQALSEANLEDSTGRLLLYATRVVRSYSWQEKAGESLSSHLARIMVQQAVEKFLWGEYEWQPDTTDLLAFLREMIHSDSRLLLQEQETPTQERAGIEVPVEKLPSYEGDILIAAPFFVDEVADLKKEVEGIVAEPESWLHASNIYLGGESPINLIGTPEEQRLWDLIRSIKHGMVS